MVLQGSRINLLPYRERRVKELRTHFFMITAVVIVIAIIAVIGINIFLGTFVTVQDSRVDRLNQLIAREDKEIAEIAKLKKQIDVLIGRKKVIESLQDEKNNPIYLFNRLSASVSTKGMFVTDFNQTGPNITMTAITDGNARISTFIASLENSNGVFSNVNLGRSEQIKIGEQNYFRFNLTFQSPIFAK